MIETGIKGRKEVTVTEKMTAEAAGSGLLPVFATPQMLALMEQTAFESVQPYLEEGCGTVGTKVDIDHAAATPVGMKVICETELIEVDRKRLVFSVTAYDEKGRIGGGIHERFIIDNVKFMKKTQDKLQKNG